MSGYEPSGRPPPVSPHPRFIQPRPPVPVAAIVGRIIAMVGIVAALTCSLIWMMVGGLSWGLAPLCTECVQIWLPPVAIGLLGSLIPFMLWVIVLIRQWRRPPLLPWSLLGWPLLGAINVWASELFSAALSSS